jgi:hypothetical protein
MSEDLDPRSMEARVAEVVAALSKVITAPFDASPSVEANQGALTLFLNLRRDLRAEVEANRLEAEQRQDTARAAGYADLLRRLDDMWPS